MSQHKKQKPGGDNRQKPTDDKQKVVDNSATRQPREQMPRPHERPEQELPGERSDKDSIGQPVQLDGERQ